MRIVAIFFILLCPWVGYAHQASDSYLNVTVNDKKIVGQWDIALRDLDYAIGIDRNDDGAITWGEVRARRDAIAAYALARLQLVTPGGVCTIAISRLLIDRHSDGRYAVLRFSANCPGGLNQLQIRYRLLFDLDPEHRGLLQLQYSGITHTAIFSPTRHEQTFIATQPKPWQSFLDYFHEGVWHIWIGVDHILFLLSLLLPAVLSRNTGRWRAVSDFSTAFVDVVKTVTAFTLAHSLTLTLAALDIISFPLRIAESVIAASVIIAALNNVYPVIHGRRWAIAFGFGLIHGFGFASVLSNLGLSSGALVRSLLGFNLGVEAGQLAIVCLFLPLAFWLRATGFYRHVVVTAGSLVISGIAGLWLIERLFDTTLFSL
jgi:hypothetical protein